MESTPLQLTIAMVEAVRSRDPVGYISAKNALEDRGWDTETVGALLGVCLLALTFAAEHTGDSDDAVERSAAASVLEYVEDDIDGWFAALVPGLRTRLRSMTSTSPDAMFHEAALASVVGEFDSSLVAVFAMLTAAAVERILDTGTTIASLYEHLSWGAVVAPDIIATILSSTTTVPSAPEESRFEVPMLPPDPRWAYDPQKWPALVAEINSLYPPYLSPDIVERRHVFARHVVDVMRAAPYAPAKDPSIVRWFEEAEPRRTAAAIAYLVGAYMLADANAQARDLDEIAADIAIALAQKLSPGEDPLPVLIDLGRFWSKIEIEVSHNAEFATLALWASDLDRVSELAHFLKEVAATGTAGDVNRVCIEVVSALRWTAGVSIERNLNTLATRAASATSPQERHDLASAFWPVSLHPESLTDVHAQQLLTKDASECLSRKMAALGDAWSERCKIVHNEVIDHHWREYLTNEAHDVSVFIDMLATCHVDHVIRMLRDT